MGKIYRATTSFESVMCFQWRNDLWVSWPRDSLNIWTWRNDFFSTLTDLLDFIWLFAAKLCYRHMLKTAPEVKAKLGDDLEVFRPARWIASEAREFLEQQNSKDLFFWGKNPREFRLFWSFWHLTNSDCVQLSIRASWNVHHSTHWLLAMVLVYAWASNWPTMKGAWSLLRRELQASSFALVIMSPNVIMLLVHLHSLRRSCNILWWNSGKDLPWRRKQPSLFYRQRMWKLA